MATTFCLQCWRAVHMLRSDQFTVPLILCHFMWDGLARSHKTLQQAWGWRPATRPQPTGPSPALPFRLGDESAVLRRLTLQRLNPHILSALHFLSRYLPTPALVHKHQYTLLHNPHGSTPWPIQYPHSIRTPGLPRSETSDSSTLSQIPSRSWLPRHQSYH